MTNFTAANVEQLVQSLLTAQLSSGPHTITLSTGVLYNLSSYSGIAGIPGNNNFGTTPDTKSGLPHIKTKVTLNVGSGGAQLAVISRTLTGPAYRHLYVEETGELTVERIQLQNGDVGSLDTGGGAIYNSGKLTLRNCRIGPKNLSNYGGGVLNVRGQVDIFNCDIYENEADWGGGLYNYVIANSCVMNVTDSRLYKNKADFGASNGGGLINFGTMTVEHCHIRENTASRGAGIASWDANAQLSVQNSNLMYNAASVSGGGLYGNAGTIQLSCSTLVVYVTGGTAPVAARNNANSGSVSITNTAMGPASAGETTGTVTITNRFPIRYPDFTMPTDALGNLIPTYAYYRDGTASKGVTFAKANFQNFPFDASGVGGPGGGGVHGSVGTGRNYSAVLSHQSGSTGSSIFVSECIHVGGIPMTIDPANTLCTNTSPPSGSVSGAGWRACPPNPPSQTYGSSTPNWRDHANLAAYFVSLGGSLVGSVTAALGSDVMHFDDVISSGLGGKLKGNTTKQNEMAALFTSSLAAIKTGDYVFIKLTPSRASDHGFLIVGWGPFRDTLDALAITSNPSTTRSATNSIPYVVDFNFGTDLTNPGTGWLQDPRPRPFYSSAAFVTTGMTTFQTDRLKQGQYDGGPVMPLYQPFNLADTTRPNWQFYHIPDTIKISPNDLPRTRLYNCG